MKRSVFASLNLVLFNLIFTDCTKTIPCFSKIRMREVASFSFTTQQEFFQYGAKLQTKILETGCLF
jgi:hypothetical protein